MTELDKYTKGGELFDGHYKLIRALSTDGATADVWLAIDVNTIDTELGEEDGRQRDETGMMVAIKIYRPKNALDIEGEQRFRDEFKIVYECRHANLLQPTSFSIFGDYPYLVMPYCSAGSSEKLIGKKLLAGDIWKFIQDVASGLNRLHTNSPQIVHQDIKPANILIDNSGNYAITDFGISSKRDGVHGYYEENSGTMAYMAPERFIEGIEPMPQSDIWAFGATLYEILKGQVPFGEDGGACQSGSNIAPASISGVSSDVNKLLQACLDKEPGNRPTAQNLVDAARVQRYPPRKTPRGLTIVFTLVAILSLALTIWRIIIPENVAVEPPAVSNQEMFENAMELMSSEEIRDFYFGYALLDSLSKLDFVPAMYQMAFTHGWYSDAESMRRKDLLGIEYDRSKNIGIPLEDSDNQKTITWLQTILEKSDTAYPIINAQAAYRLAGYYTNGRILMKDEERGKELLNESELWAERAGDTVLLEKIGRNLAKFGTNRY